MAADDWRAVIGGVRQTLLAEQEQGPSDGQLLTRFLEQQDEAAFAALVRRHAPLVWGVCRRLLPNLADAEDAFQATFLVLVRKAASIRPREMVANWLYGVARQTARKARATAARRFLHERQVAQMPEPEASERRDDLGPLLDEELSRLPARYRAVLVLCDLEGQTRSVAARHLGVAEGTVASRLARARSMLARRLARRGVGITASTLVAALAQEAVSAPPPGAVVSSAIRAAWSVAAGQAGAVVVSARISTLAEGVVKAMLLTRLEKMAAILLVLGVAVLSCGVLAARWPPGPAAPGKTEAAKGREQLERREAADPAQANPGPLPAGAVAQFGSPRLQDFTIDRSAAFSPDGKRLATSGSNHPICVWDVASGELVRTYNNRGSVYDLRWRADGKLSALTFFNHNVFLMQEFGSGAPDLSQEEEQQLQKEAMARELNPPQGKDRPDRLDYCYLSPDGRRVVAIWLQGQENRRRAAIYQFKHAHTSTIAKPEREVALPSGYGTWLSSDGTFLVAHVLPTGDEPIRLRAYDLTAAGDRPAWELTFPGPQQDRRPESCFSPDGKRVVMLLWDEKVEVWDGPSGKRVRDLGKLPRTLINSNGERPGIEVSVDGKRVALLTRSTSGAESGRIVDVDTGAEVCRLTPQPLPFVSGVARFSADGKRLARAGSGVAAVWDADNGADACPLPGHRGQVNSLAVLGSGKQVVTAGEDLTVRAWESASGKEVWRMMFPQTMTVKFATSDGALFVDGKARTSGRATACLDAATGKQRALPGQLAAKDFFLACSPDGKQVLTLDATTAAFRIWSWPAGQLQTTFPLSFPRQRQPLQPGPMKLAECRMAHFTPDGKHFAAVVYYRDPAEQQIMWSGPDHPFVETWDVAAGRQLRSIKLDTRHFPVLIPHATGLYYFGKDGEIRDTVSGRLLVKLQPPANRGISWDFVSGMALSPDGRTVAVSCGFPDGHLLLFETRTGRFREKLPLTEKWAAGLAFLPDGRLVSLSRTAVVWAVGLQPAVAGKNEPLGEAEQAAAWQGLTDPDAEKAWPAMAKLLAAPEETVKLIRQHVHPIPKTSEEMRARIIRDLDSEEFAKREAASMELDRLGLTAVPRAKRELERAASAEVERRLRQFLSEHDRPDLSPGELRSLRAVEILEAAATPAARQLLADLARGAPEARLTREAAAAERRLIQR
jgi:RNA polymerase sigma factor (sigma-70 family)